MYRTYNYIHNVSITYSNRQKEVGKMSVQIKYVYQKSRKKSLGMNCLKTEQESDSNMCWIDVLQKMSIQMQMAPYTLQHTCRKKCYDIKLSNYAARIFERERTQLGGSNRSKDKQIADMIETSNSQLQLIGALTMKMKHYCQKLKKVMAKVIFKKEQPLISKTY